MDSVIIVATIGAVSGVLGAIIAGLWQRRKSNAEAHNTEADANEQIRQTVMSLIEPLRKRIEELEKEVTRLQQENADLNSWARELVCQVQQLGGQPVTLKKTRQRKPPL